MWRWGTLWGGALQALSIVLLAITTKLLSRYTDTYVHTAYTVYTHALCILHACCAYTFVACIHWNIYWTRRPRVRDVRFECSDIFVLVSKLPIRPRPKIECFGSERQFETSGLFQLTPGFRLCRWDCRVFDLPNTSEFVWLPVPSNIVGFKL